MVMLANVGKLLLLQEEHAPAVVQVQSAVSSPATTPATVATAGLIATGQKVEAPAGEGLLIPAVAPAVIATAVPAPKSKFAAAASVVQVVLAGAYSVLAPYLLDAALNALTVPGALERLGISHEGLTVALFGALVMWRDRRRRKKEAAEAAT